MDYSKYETVIGLEVHAQLQTQSKLFSGDANRFGGHPNTQINPITLAHPGTLPKINKKAIEYAIKMGLACHCAIETLNCFARKNYFYPDLPKGYQISQHTTPICIGGYISIFIAGIEKKIYLNRIHIEEDAGKSIHDAVEGFTCIDYNRAGTPLIEIVTEPCIQSAEEAFQYLTEIRKLVRWLDICDGNMEEGSLRCDANISIRLKGATELGTKVEVKNLNSIRNVKKAIEYEVERMIALTENGKPIVQQTRSFDANNDTTFAIREKEEANDYRYFPDPDLVPFFINQSTIEVIQKTMPALPNALKQKLQHEYGLSVYDAHQLCDDKHTAAFFETTATHTRHFKAIANWMLGPLKQYLNEQGHDFSQLTLQPKTLAGIIQLVDDGKLNFSTAANKLLPAIITTNADPAITAEKMNLIQVSDNNAVLEWVHHVITAMPEKVAEYKKGKKGLMGLFVGEVKKLSKGKADPKITTTILEKILNAK
ncbi:MAG: Asp-tRNA(Asn)/Glu-tRNA(Gln) amidotransferase subunit GatB [Hydrotalea flava]|uniref:Asp-tRNA(Asn)/Glu-tRNA(Gln) amidotransferase subunit GatB n=1 Tax=Hydrotalea sp. TaxID=2881279 RepID=UPI0016AA3C8A|nr:Asp-tRNA(Asn)/Glu-tRNA(Gln) amidotransferase subunit GatB [Hydrotalea sp.]MBY0348007.1 Asp-tRNA(Asn)/Glu-tRNA(Gln) amidotransferase subunit GatB [Hydrotalea flava]NIM35105.1 Asp-tRNA(Asn)/Glu-tRNA(Gln) amidotransferase subunit GatB [Hydrotalea flava]NIM37931.1 Asp-tRNA(Asn)/Glu-tRNA(Gln) amidotransferase subunit GatB [Hydrotalea flava]NIN03100.1 Asp-tRNA(Asn)/Glu-tRNA(Gln) amidotransferase subunit GatB [Hydrotalea flava]NIN14785.1 Asp-tRNA(Asn)/Glu-tRNA(Gln) amidotransferase subunit GatB [H